MEGGKEGGRERDRERERERGREGGREGERKRKEEREGGREREKGLFARQDLKTHLREMALLKHPIYTSNPINAQVAE